MENKENPQTKKFNQELGESLSRIEIILKHFSENKDPSKDELNFPERLKEGSNPDYVHDICQLFYGLRNIFDEKYGFDFGMYNDLRDNNKTGIIPNLEILNRYSNIYDLVGETEERLEKIK